MALGGALTSTAALLPLCTDEETGTGCKLTQTGCDHRVWIRAQVLCFSFYICTFINALQRNLEVKRDRWELGDPSYCAVVWRRVRWLSRLLSWASPAMWPSLLVSLAPRPAITVAVLLLHVAVLAPQVDG